VKLKILIVFTSALLLGGCGNYKQWFQTFVPKDEDGFARRFMELVRAGQIDAASNMLDPRIRTGDTVGGLAQIQQMLSQGEPLSIESVGVSFLSLDGKTRAYLTYQIHFSKSWVLADAIVEKAGGNLSLLGFHVNPLPASWGEINAFTLAGKSPLHYLFLATVLFLPLFLIYMVVLIVRAKVKRKWLWIPFMFVGICHFSLNWTTGELGFQPIYFHIPGVGMYRAGLYGPWALFASIPIGAIIFLIKRKKLEQRSAAERGEESVVPEEGNAMEGA
jgi:hypothetical protein